MARVRSAGRRRRRRCRRLVVAAAEAGDEGDLLRAQRAGAGARLRAGLGLWPGTQRRRRGGLNVVLTCVL